MASFLHRVFQKRLILSSSAIINSLIKPRSKTVIGGVTVLSLSLYSFSNHKVHAAQIVSSIDVSKFMDLPITDLAMLERDKDTIRAKMEILILKTQADFCHALEEHEPKGAKFQVDRWSRKNPEEGGGITCTLQEGQTFEKAGVNVTVMSAPLSKKLQESMRSRGKDLPESENFTFFAAGVSSVIHPRNPYVPTVHFNYRYFEVQDQNGNLKDWWFGGGTDLTPYYLDEDDVRLFHRALKKPCDSFSSKAYASYKKWCDKYFFNQFRGERRGVGGIFFDDLTGKDPKKIFGFVEKCAKSVIPSYIPIVEKNKNASYTDDERRWQLVRRGRYVEFNLVYDRGTKFGFATPGARIESILVSMPLIARWEYKHVPAPGSPEDKLMQVLKEPKEWI